jgi:hypothetical protein
MPSSTENGNLSVSELHSRFLKALGEYVGGFSDLAKKPLDIDLRSPLPGKWRVYLYNCTYPPGGRTMGEHKVQLIIPGQARKQRANFDSSAGRIPLLAGYRPDIGIFILWDAEMYVDFSYSRNVQVMPDTVYEAFARGIGRQQRHLRTNEDEVVITADAAHLAEALLERQKATLKRLLGEKP